MASTLQSSSVDRFAGLRRWWTQYEERALRIGIAPMALAAAFWLSYEFWRLLWQPGEWGAVDLRLIQGWVQAWFSPAAPVGLFPPASYPMLWPLMGWLSFGAARWLWALTTIAALAWLCALTVRESLAATALERTVAGLMPLAISATGAAIGNGQLVVHLMPTLIAGVLLVHRQQATSWRRDLMAALPLTLALVKPNIAVPFFWILLFASRSVRPAVLTAALYAVLTWFAMSFKPNVDLMFVLQGWMRRSSAAAALPGQGNVSNVNIWLVTLGLPQWIFPVSLFILLALGIWVYRYRRAELWLLLGVTGYVARIWSYHRWYEDLLVLLPMIALFRIAKSDKAPTGVIVMAGILLAATLVVMMVAPGGLFLLPPPWNSVYVAVQCVVWMAGLVFLARQARRTSRAIDQT